MQVASCDGDLATCNLQSATCLIQLQLHREIHAHLFGKAEQGLHLLAAGILKRPSAAGDRARHRHVEIDQFKAIGHNDAAAMRLGRLESLGRAIRSLASEPIPADADFALFVNLHVTDLTDPSLSDPESPLSKIAHRVVLEITERSSLDEVKDARRRVAALREMGFRIAVDDLGAGYAGLSSFTLLEPEIVKLDMSLVRDIHVTSTKQKVVRSMTALSKDMGMTVVAEGVETREERDCLVDLGCDLLQGFLFAKPGRAFPGVAW